MSEASLLNVGEVILNFAVCAVARSFYHVLLVHGVVIKAGTGSEETGNEETGKRGNDNYYLLVFQHHTLEVFGWLWYHWKERIL